MTEQELIDKIKYLIEEEKETRSVQRIVPSKIFISGRISAMQDILKLIENKTI